MSHKVIVKTLKQILKSKKIKYKELGDKIGMSESGIKKLFISSDISLSRLTQITDALGIPLSEVLKISEEEAFTVVHFTTRQEENLLADDQLFRVFWMITVDEKSFSEILKIEKLSAEKLEKHYRKLEKIDLIKKTSHGKYIAFHKMPNKWAGDGRLIQKINRQLSEIVLHKVLDSKDPAHVHRLFFIKLGQESLDDYRKDMRNLCLEYARRSGREKLTLPVDQLKPVSTLVAISPTEFF